MVVAGTGGVKKGVHPSIQVCMASTTFYSVREVYFPESHAGLGYPVPITIMAQELEDAKQKWSCNSFQELQEEAEVWGWDDMVSNKCTRWAKCHAAYKWQG